jgi:hypothetical protein
MIIDQPWKAHWAFVFPKSSSKAEEWKLFAQQVLNLSVGPNPSGEKCKDKIRKWQLKYYVNESDSGMLHEDKNTWPVIVENLRVRKIDTSLLHPHGVHVPNGVEYNVVEEVRIVDLQLAAIAPNSLDEARRVLKYVIVIGHELAYAQHVSSKKDRMCSKIENMMECGMHLDNRVGHKQFNTAVEDVMNVGTSGDIQEKLDRISNVICHALSHLPLDENEDMLNASYSLRYDSQIQ